MWQITEIPIAPVSFSLSFFLCVIYYEMAKDKMTLLVFDAIVRWKHKTKRKIKSNDEVELV